MWSDAFSFFSFRSFNFLFCCHLTWLNACHARRRTAHADTFLIVILALTSTDKLFVKNTRIISRHVTNTSGSFALATGTRAPRLPVRRVSWRASRITWELVTCPVHRFVLIPFWHYVRGNVKKSKWFLCFKNTEDLMWEYLRNIFLVFRRGEGLRVKEPRWVTCGAFQHLFLLFDQTWDVRNTFPVTLFFPSRKEEKLLSVF